MSKANTKPKATSTAADKKVAAVEKKLEAEKAKVAAEKAKLAAEKAKAAAEKKRAREELAEAKREARLQMAAEKKRLKEQERLDKDAAKFRANEEKKRIKEQAKADAAEQKRKNVEEQKRQKAEADAKLKAEQDKLKEEKKLREASEKEQKKAEERRAKIEEELAKCDLKILDYRKRLVERNKDLAEAIEEQKRIKRENTEREKANRPSYSELKKQVDAEINEKRFFREQIKHKLKKVSKESESGLARMGASGLMGAGNFISDKLNDFVDQFPGLKQLNSARKFVKSNMQGAREAKLKRMTKERMSEARKGPGKVKNDFADFRENSRRGKENEKNRDGENRVNSYFEQIIDLLKTIRTTQLLGTLAKFGTGFVKSIIDGVTKGFGAVLGALGITKILGKLAESLGMKKLAEKLTTGGPRTKGPAPTTGNPNPKPGGPQAQPGPNQPGPKPSGPKPAPAPQPKKTGGMQRVKTKITEFISKIGVKGAAAGAAKVGARFVPYVGWGLLLKDMYDLADQFGVVDEADKAFDELFKGLMAGEDNSPEGQEQRLEQSKKYNAGPGYYGQQSPVASTPYTYGGAYNPALAAKYSKPLPGTNETPGTQIEKAHTKLVESEKQVKELERIQTAQAAAQSTAQAVNASVNNVSTVNNNSTSIIQFNNSEYQTSHQKGTQVIR